MSSPASGHILFKSDSGEVGEVGEVGEATDDGELKKSAHAQERDAEDVPTESAVPANLRVEEGGAFREGCLVRVVPEIACGGDIGEVISITATDCSTGEARFHVRLLGQPVTAVQECAAKDLKVHATPPRCMLSQSPRHRFTLPPHLIPLTTRH